MAAPTPSPTPKAKNARILKLPATKPTATVSPKLKLQVATPTPPGKIKLPPATPKPTLPPKIKIPGATPKPTLPPKMEMLLQYHDRAGDFIATPAFALAPELLLGDPAVRIGQPTRVLWSARLLALTGYLRNLWA